MNESDKLVVFLMIVLAGLCVAFSVLMAWKDDPLYGLVIAAVLAMLWAQFDD